VTTLAQLSIGARGRVARVAGHDEISTRLMEMGLTPGVDVHVLGAAPLGDPIELELRGYRLSVRRSEANRVELEQVNATHSHDTGTAVGG
jgi:ferrous iron transport protein A